MDDTGVIHPDLDHDCGTCSGVHRPRVVPYAGIKPWCECGWTPHGGYTLADHLRDLPTATGEDHPNA